MSVYIIRLQFSISLSSISSFVSTLCLSGSCDVTRIPESSTAHFAIYPTTTASTSSVEDADAVAAANEASSASYCRGMIPTIHREALLRAGHQLMYAL